MPTLVNNASDSQYIPPDYQVLALRVFDWFTLRVHCQRLLYFILFYALLAAFFFGYMNALMYFQVPRDYPRLTGAYSALRMNPGLSIVPQPDIYNSLILIRTTVPLPIYSLNDHITAFLHSYQDNTGCTELEDCINNLYGWLPDPVDGAEGVLVRCEGVDENDTNNLGTIRYYDMEYKFSAVPSAINPGKLENGTFRSMYFPYQNQACYQQPLVFVQFDGVKKTTLIRVRCYLVAKNIHVDFERGEGSVSFEILIE
ncbi:unnamed protein product [Dibothriocephalus latus]|uniref:Sodium/potassium-transporting ATPase subunit beta n=1 Tax=Dibothriocephalus latus TaxID=60516 RepID=A0A3P7LG22_DIBLA|nr:unnamed protein product [Dibothriocephalus latus]